MKRVGNLWERLVSFPNLLRASRKARKGKRDRRDVAAFEYDAERELHRIRDELQAGAYPFGPYHTFTITEPKQRLISAALLPAAACRRPAVTPGARLEPGATEPRGPWLSNTRAGPTPTCSPGCSAT